MKAHTEIKEFRLLVVTDVIVVHPTLCRKPPKIIKVDLSLQDYKL